MAPPAGRHDELVEASERRRHLLHPGGRAAPGPRHGRPRVPLQGQDGGRTTQGRRHDGGGGDANAGVEITTKFLVVSSTTYLGNLVVLRYMW